ncbi:MAG: ZIP family metal transporter [Lachnospiraceae bacterium]|nr:ZIP family metal transporter [Lachnospiraceae bacterium]
MTMNVFVGIVIPFWGTSLGSALVFLMGGKMNRNVQRALTGFAGGVMVAASVWSLLIPAMDQSAHMGKLSFIPAVVGFLLGMVFLLILDTFTPHMHMGSDKAEGVKTKLDRTTMLVLAVALHNIPEGMAVGAVFAGLISDSAEITLLGAFALSIGIAIQNFPEGAIISMPLKAEGVPKGKAFLYGALSGAVEPLAALITILLSGIMVPILPYLLSFAAGAMIYVVVEELIPEMSEGEHSNIGTMFFAIGFSLMMILDVALG